jgi:hypothetical protein
MPGKTNPEIFSYIKCPGKLRALFGTAAISCTCEIKKAAGTASKIAAADPCHGGAGSS